MNEITDKVKKETALQYIIDNPHNAAIDLTSILGRLADRTNAGSLTYLVTTKNEDSSVVYRLQISTHSLEYKYKLDQQYFIDITFYSPRNNLEKLLQDQFRNHEHALIQYAQIPDLEAIYKDTVDRYKRNKGRASVAFNQSSHGDDKIWIKIGESISMTLIRVTDDFFYYRKEDTNV